MNIFRVNNNERIIKNGFLAIILAFIGYFIISGNSNLTWTILVVFLLLSILIFSIYLSFKRKVIVEDTRLIIINYLSKSVYGIKDIRGYRILNDQISIEPIKNAWKPIIIDDDLENKQDLINWLSSKYPNLQKINTFEEVNNEKIAYDEFLNNTKFGDTVDDRINNLRIAKRNVKLLNWISAISFGWTVFFGNPIEICILISIFIPIISFVLIKKYKGLIVIFGIDSNPHFPPIFKSIVIPIVGVLFRLSFNYSIYNLYFVFIPMLILSILLLSLNIKVNRNRFSTPDLIAITCLIPFYIYILIVSMNCVFDKSEFEPVNYKIGQKEIIQTSKSPNRVLTLEPINTGYTLNTINVSSSIYDNVNVGDEIQIKYKRGFLGILWYIHPNQEN